MSSLASVFQSLIVRTSGRNGVSEKVFFFCFIQRRTVGDFDGKNIGKVTLFMFLISAKGSKKVITERMNERSTNQGELVNDVTKQPFDGMYTDWLLARCWFTSPKD